MWVDIVLNLAGEVVTSLIVELVHFVFERIKEVVASNGENDCSLNGSIITDRDCKYMISATSAAGYDFNDIDFNQLLSDMQDLRETESNEKICVVSFEAPCSIDLSRDEKIVCDGVGNYSLWKITYSGQSGSLQKLYDAANKCFITLNFDESCMAEFSSMEDR